MNLDPDEDLQLIVETARQFASERLAGQMREAEAQRGVDAGAVDVYRDIGLAGLEVPEDLGGAGLGAVARSLVNEELGAADPGAALLLDGMGPALYPLLEMGADVPGLVGGADPGSERILLVTKQDATFEQTGDRIRARVPWVPADAADAVVLLTGEQCMVVRGGLEFTEVRGAGLRSAGAAELQIDSETVWRSAPDQNGAGRALARARIYVASLLLGVLRAACDFSNQYAQERQAFGRPIAHHQALAFLMTDMQMAVDGARFLVHEAAWRLDHGLPGEAAAASAYAECIDAARLVGPNGVQILGGHGFMADYPVEKQMREARALGLLLGGFDAAIEDSGRLLCEQTSPLALGAAGVL